jgi:outer membrane receptor protein involved in Fe transport
MTSVSAFHKRIRDITLTDIRQNLGVWTATPVNAGMATVRGIEFEGKATIGRLAARVSLARNWSRVDNVQGPDNRIAGQPAYNGNLGLDYSTASGRIDVGGSYTHTSRVVSRSSASIVDADSMKRQLDLYTLWKRDARSRLRLSVSDLLQQDLLERRTFEGNAPLLRATTYRVRATWRLVWEHSL